MPRHYHSRIQSVDRPKLHEDQQIGSRGTSTGERKSQVSEDLQSALRKNTAPLLQGITMEDLDAIVKHHARELDQLQDKCTKSEKDAEKYRKESSKLRDQSDEARDQCVEEAAYRAESEKQHKEIERQHRLVTARYKHIVQKVISPYASAKNLKWNTNTPETMAMVLEPLVADAVDASDLRNQVATLQNEMSAKRYKVAVVSDEHFAQDFRTLANIIKSITRVVRPMQDLNFTEFTGSSGLLQGVNQNLWSARTCKKFLIEAWIWSVLCDFVFSHPFGWLGKVGLDLAVMWTSVYGRDRVGGWPKPTLMSETWRATTSTQVAEQLHPKAMSEGFVDDEPSFQNMDYDAINHRAQIFSLIMSFLSTISGVKALPEVHTIVHKALTLAMQMSTQRVRLQITYPPVGLPFDDKIMKPMDDPEDDDEEEDVKDGAVAFVLHPGLAKWGNAHGKDLDQRFDIVKAAVKLAEAGPPEGIPLP